MRWRGKYPRRQSPLPEERIPEEAIPSGSVYRNTDHLEPLRWDQGCRLALFWSAGPCLCLREYSVEPSWSHSVALRGGGLWGRGFYLSPWDPSGFTGSAVSSGGLTAPWVKVGGLEEGGSA